MFSAIITVVNALYLTMLTQNLVIKYLSLATLILSQIHIVYLTMGLSESSSMSIFSLKIIGIAVIFGLIFFYGISQIMKIGVPIN